MKNFIWISMSFLCLVACTKEKKEGACRVVKYTIYNQAGTASVINLTYNTRGQLTGLKQSNSPEITLTYFNDSVVIRQDTERTVYYLNSNGLADSSYTIYTSNNPNGLSFRRYYTYFPEGFMHTEQSIFSQLYNGSIIRDTSHTTYTIANGNITTINYHNGLVFEFEYGDEPVANNRLLQPFVFGEYQFLGKTSRNLVKKLTAFPTGITNYTYQVHGNGTASKMTGTSDLDGPTYREFVYQCD